MRSTGPGGAPDIIARLMGPWLSQRLGTQFFVENRAGGGNNIGTEAGVRRAAHRSCFEPFSFQKKVISVSESDRPV
jgi:tripartite-type tricarboxylate transporter receptor subunit TctC